MAALVRTRLEVPATQTGPLKDLLLACLGHVESNPCNRFRVGIHLLGQRMVIPRRLLEGPGIKIQLSQDLLLCGVHSAQLVKDEVHTILQREGALLVLLRCILYSHQHELGLGG